jgi:hypothetical protein
VTPHIIAAPYLRRHPHHGRAWLAPDLPPTAPETRGPFEHDVPRAEALATFPQTFAPFHAAVYRVRFESKEAKAVWMQHGAERDSMHPLVLQWARVFAPFPRPERERRILNFCQFSIRYVRDPKVEVLDSSPVCLTRGFGDCDAKARLFCALCLACGVDAKIDPVFRGDRFPHVRARVFEPDDWQPGDHAGWIVADPTILNSDIGSLPEHPKTNISHGALFLAT